VITIRDFQIMSALNTIIARLSPWKISWRGLPNSFLRAYHCWRICSLMELPSRSAVGAAFAIAQVQLEIYQSGSLTVDTVRSGKNDFS